MNDWENFCDLIGVPIDFNIVDIIEKEEVCIDKEGLKSFV
ncbi:hypothetical protein SPONL_734 [uncultured Candidatus Thioglobus sp.]|nr:hypothetical protein SPONL_734 [uncultured Candidatus Thioglobus sp.]